MPLPKPKPDEDKDDWDDRCMSNPTMNEEYPDQKQRYAICQRLWEESKEGKSAMAGMERRHKDFTTLELREGEGAVYLEGHAAVFDSETVIADWFREKIEPGAFTATIAEDDIRALFNHDSNHVLGRNKSGTLMLEEDNKGLFMRVKLPQTTMGGDLQESIKRGDITGQSFMFRVVKDEWKRAESPGDLDLRTIKQAQLFDVGPVTFPAYEATDITVAKREYGARLEEEKAAEIRAAVEAAEQEELAKQRDTENENYHRQVLLTRLREKHRES